jgi:hypothetical protein
MKALILDAALHGGAPLDWIDDAVEAELSEAGIPSERIRLRKLAIAYCQGCFECWVKTPGLCKTRDAAHDVARAFIRSDLVVLVTPVTFGGYSSEAKKALDRLICLVSPFFTRIDGEVHHHRRYARYPAFMAVGLLPKPDADEERVFETLVRRNAINMHAPVHASAVVHDRAEPLDRLKAAVGSLLARMEVAA